MNKNKVIGCLYGQVIGDALGTRYEFKKSYQIQQLFKQDRINGFLPILGGGPFSVDKGQCTDDTELAFGLAKGIIENRGYQKEKIAEKYIKWFQSEPFDIGNNTRQVFYNANTYQDVITNASNFSVDSLSNGCLMRISPLAIYGIFLNNNQLLQYCKEDCTMTNPNPITINAVQVYVMAIKTALLINDRQKIFEEAKKYVKKELIYKLMKRAKNKESGFLLSDGKIIDKADGKYMGYFGIAFQMAFYELLYGNSFYDSMLHVISQGGDTDTNGCIVGTLLGAFYGNKNIPYNWIRNVTIRNKRYHKYLEINQLDIDGIAIKLAIISKFSNEF